MAPYTVNYNPLDNQPPALATIVTNFQTIYENTNSNVSTEYILETLVHLEKMQKIVNSFKINMEGRLARKAPINIGELQFNFQLTEDVLYKLLEKSTKNVATQEERRPLPPTTRHR